MLTEVQQRVAANVLDEESARVEHVVVSLSGAHAYGFPSPDSDLDLKAVHVDRTRDLLALCRSHPKSERMQVIDGVEIDYSSNELQMALVGVLQGNGNFIERFLGAIALRESPLLMELRPLVRRALSRRVHRHYRGFATSQLKEWEKTGHRSAKKLLYVLRTTLTGAHLLRTGEVQTDLTRLMEEYGFSAARELIEQKRAGELSELATELSERWRVSVGRAFDVLDAAEASSVLPENAPNEAELSDWLIEVRKRRL